jgi:orotate phosphoribosyltransferase
VEREELGRELVRAALLEGDFVLSSGRRSRYYFDKYLFETDPRLLGAIAEHLASLLPDDTQRLAGPELGAVALAAAVSLRAGLPFVIVRRAGKEYGTARAIEGRLQAGERLTLVEDVLTTGSQAVQAAERLREAGAEVRVALAVVDREEGAAELLAAAHLELRALFRRTELDRWR